MYYGDAFETRIMCFSRITAGLADCKNENEDLFSEQSVISMYLFSFSLD